MGRLRRCAASLVEEDIGRWGLSHSNADADDATCIKPPHRLFVEARAHGRTWTALTSLWRTRESSNSNQRAWPSSTMREVYAVSGCVGKMHTRRVVSFSQRSRGRWSNTYSDRRADCQNGSGKPSDKTPRPRPCEGPRGWSCVWGVAQAKKRTETANRSYTAGPWLAGKYGVRSRSLQHGNASRATGHMRERGFGAAKTKACGTAQVPQGKMDHRVQLAPKNAREPSEAGPPSRKALQVDHQHVRKRPQADLLGGDLVDLAGRAVPDCAHIETHHATAALFPR